MAERIRPPSLLLVVRGTLFVDMLAEATREAKDYFGDAPFRAVSFDAVQADQTRAVGGEAVRTTYVADVVFSAAGAPRRAPGAPSGHPPGYFELEPDDDEEVKIP
jgi:hypothetical protein